MSITLVTGTDTGIGKTVVTAALVARAASSGCRVAVVKPAQTGAATGEPGDVDEVVRLTGGTDAYELQRQPDPLAPTVAARLSRRALIPMESIAGRVSQIATAFDHVVVEGSGGLLVRLDESGATMMELADSLARFGHRVRWVVVTSLALGTLNHTELTVMALRSRGYEPVGLVIGSSPASPGLAERHNLDELPRQTGVPLLGTLAAGAGGLTPQAFTELALASLHPPL